VALFFVGGFMKFPEFFAKMLVPFFMVFILGLFAGGFMVSNMIPRKPENENIDGQVTVTKQECPKVETGPLNNQSLGEAKKYYEKAFSLFLATIGAKLTSSEKNEFSKLMSDPKNYLAQNKRMGSNSSGPIVDTGKEKRARPAMQFYGQQATITKKNLEVKDLQKEAAKFVLKDSVLFHARAIPVKEWGPAIEKVNGSFTGKLYRFDKNPMEIEDMELHVNFGLNEENKVDGEFQLIISKDGKIYSDKRGSGGNGAIRVNPKDPTSILIDASPNSFFHGKLNDLSVLNYYYDGKHIGVAHISSE
jgi:hypothetical protein